MSPKMSLGFDGLVVVQPLSSISSILVSIFPNYKPVPLCLHHHYDFVCSFAQILGDGFSTRVFTQKSVRKIRLMAATFYAT